MDSSCSSTTCVFIIFLIFQCSGSSASSVESTIKGNQVTSAPETGKKVSVGLYYESLCPFSANFIVNYLSDLFNDEDLLASVDLHLSPWGNARLKSNTTFSCQHGPYECLLNTVEACAIDVWPELKKHFAFIYCVESLVYERKYQQWQSCFETLELDSRPVLDCYSSGYGTKLELRYAAETNSLQPAHQYVPWVVVNGEPLYEDYENYLSYICEALKSTVAPKACSELSTFLIRGQKAGKTFPICHKDTIISKLFERIKSTGFSWM